MSENNITITNTNVVNVPDSRGAGTVLMLVFFWWLLVGFWWPLLACAWLLWMLVAAVVTIWNDGFFGRTWFQPWPIWLFGIR